MGGDYTAQALFDNDWNSSTSLTIKSEIYEAFVNPEVRFCKVYFRATYFHIFINKGFIHNTSCLT